MLRLGLECITEVLQRLRNPHHDFQALHVAGTNGKGSTCALLEAALLACLAPAGLRVGKFVSPFLVEPRDGVWLDGAPLAPEAWAAALAEVAAAATAAPPLAPTPFEQWTAAAFVAFARAGVRVAVVEVGVGGGGDATNALPPPLLALVTPIAMDHADLLGPGLADIAGHKAGIFKAGGGGALSAPGQAPEVLAVLRARAEAAGLALEVAPALPWARRGVLRVERGAGAEPLLLPLALAGDFQAANASLAWAALQRLARSGALPHLRDAAAAAAAWARVQWRGRAELVQLRVPAAPAPRPAPPRLLQCTLDGGHNAHAMAALGEELAWRAAQVAGQPSPALALVLACGAARNAEENVGLLLGALRARLPGVRVTVFAVAYALPQGMPWAAARAPEALAAAVRAAAGPGVTVTAAPSVVEALAAIASDEELRGEGAWRAICGSLYLVSDVARLCEAVPLGEGGGGGAAEGGPAAAE
jgi:dihydrofolate synthase/folylpolyglutamate synthase